MPGWCARVYSHQGQSSSIQMQKAVMIVERYRERGHILPRRLKDPTKAQETKDAINISTWKSSLKGYNRVTCSKELCTYLDDNMPAWRIDHHKSKPRSALGKEKARLALLAGTTASELNQKEKSTELLMPIAQGIVARFRANYYVYPSLKFACRNDPARAQEYSDAKQLHSWKSHTDQSLAPEVFEFLDEHMRDWKNSHVTSTQKNAALTKAREIFRRCSMRDNMFPRLATCRPSDPELILEHKDAVTMRGWKFAFTTEPDMFCSVLRDYLDDKLAPWRNIDLSSPLPYDIMKADKTHARTTAAMNKRKQSSVVETESTDGEFSSEDGSAYSSEDEFGQTKIRKLFPSNLALASQPTSSDESAGIAALLQLSTGVSTAHIPTSSPTVPMTTTITTATMTAPSGAGTMVATAGYLQQPPPLPVVLPTATPLLTTGSTYGNKCRYQNQFPVNTTTNSQYPSTSGGLLLSSSGMHDTLVGGNVYGATATRFLS